MTIAGSKLDRRRAGTPAIAAVPASAVAWINGRRAMVVTMGEEGRISTCSVDRGLEPEASFLALVARAIGDRDRVVILGPTSHRLKLEREYVARHPRAGRLVDVELSGPLSEAALIDRSRELAGSPGDVFGG
jgi:hypothetical protein